MFLRFFGSASSACVSQKGKCQVRSQGSCVALQSAFTWDTLVIQVYEGYAPPGHGWSRSTPLDKEVSSSLARHPLVKGNSIQILKVFPRTPKNRLLYMGLRITPFMAIMDIIKNILLKHNSIAVTQNYLLTISWITNHFNSFNHEIWLNTP